MLFGSEKFKSAADLAKQAVRDPSNFNWTFIALFAVVIIIYAIQYKNKNYRGIAACLGLYSVHWFYEIMNACICAGTGYALWTVSPESTSFILLIGVSWELSMMFAIAGFTTLLLPEDRKAKILGMNNRVVYVIGTALLFSVVEIFLAWTPAFIWVYKWWGAIPVFVTTYIPFFLAAVWMYDAKPKTRYIFIGSLTAVNIILLAVLIPLEII